MQDHKETTEEAPATPAPPAPPKTAEEYIKLLAPARITTDSGFTFQVRRIRPENWGEIYRGLPTFTDPALKGSVNPDEIIEMHKRIWSACVDGLVEPDGTLVVMAYEAMLQADIADVAGAVLAGGPFDGPESEALRRSLS